MGFKSKVTFAGLAAFTALCLIQNTSSATDGSGAIWYVTSENMANNVISGEVFSGVGQNMRPHDLYFNLQIFPGVGGTLAANAVARSNEGSPSVLLADTSLAISQTFYRSLPYNAVKQLRPLGLIAKAPMVIVARPGLFRDFNDLKETMRMPNGTRAVPWFTSGNSTTSHLCAALTSAYITREQPQFVHYRDTTSAVTDLRNSRNGVLCGDTAALASDIQRGLVVVLATATQNRISGLNLGNVPTLKEIGFDGIDLWNSYGLYTSNPASVDSNVLMRSLQLTMESPRMIEALQSIGAVKLQQGSDAHRAFLTDEFAKTRELMNRAHMLTGN